MTVDSDFEPDTEFIYLGSEFSKILEGPVKNERAVEKGRQKEPPNSWKSRQEARLHGAFTGGFSAGYFNTVGSKEGWSTSTFKSSRGSRAETIKQLPEQFMDEEDFSEYGIAPKSINVTGTYSSKGSAILSSGKTNSSQLLSDHKSLSLETERLSQLLEPAEQSFGAKLYRKQLHGKHDKLKEDENAAAKTYGCSLPPELDKFSVHLDADSEGNLVKEFFDAAEAYQTPEASFRYHGLGYKGLEARDVARSNLDDTAKLYASRGLSLESINVNIKVKAKGSKKEKSIRGFAFGVGIDEDNDDFDNVQSLYGFDDITQYDFSLGGQLDDTKSNVVSTGEGEVQFVEGRKTSKVVRQFFKPPELPKHFKPSHKFQDTESESKMPAIGDKDRAALNALQRGQKLGESYPVSVLIPDEQRKRLAKSIDLSSDSKLSSQGSSKTNEEGKVNLHEKESKKDVKNQMFYTRKFEQASETLEWEKQSGPGIMRSHLYQPMLAQIQSRFAKEDVAGSSRQEITKEDEADEKTKQQVEAVKVNMFGKLTRTVYEWHPDKLLCRRFNVPNPFPESEFVGTVDGKKKISKHEDFAKSSAGLGFVFTEEEMKSKQMVEDAKKSSNHLNIPSNRKHLTDKTRTVDEKQERAEKTVVQHQSDTFIPICPKPDLFASVFASSSDEESSESENEEAEKLTVTSLASQYEDKAKNRDGLMDYKVTEKISDSINQSNLSLSYKDANLMPKSLSDILSEKAENNKKPAKRVTDNLSSRGEQKTLQVDDSPIEEYYGPPLPPSDDLSKNLNDNYIKTELPSQKDIRRHKHKRRSRSHSRSKSRDRHKHHHEKKRDRSRDRHRHK